MAAKGGHIDFMFLGPPPLTRPLDPLLALHCVLKKEQNYLNFCGQRTHMCRRLRITKAVFLRFAFPPGSPLGSNTACNGKERDSFNKLKVLTNLCSYSSTTENFGLKSFFSIQRSKEQANSEWCKISQIIMWCEDVW